MVVLLKKIFISGVQNELAEDRKAVSEFIGGDILLRRYFDVFLFESIPAMDRRSDEFYLSEIGRSDIYLGIFSERYGTEDSDGLSPTEKEFDRATEAGKYRLVFVKGQTDENRSPKMIALIRKVERQLIRRRYSDISELTSKVYGALIEYLIRDGSIQVKPLDAAACRDASIEDISQDGLSWFLERAEQERNFPLPQTTPVATVLTHLNLLDNNQPTCAAILLFGKNPQRFFPSARIKCLQFRSGVVEKPIPSYQIFGGTLFDQIDKAIDFVASSLNRSIKPSDVKAASEVEHEIPLRVVREAIVNAVAHRDYASTGSVQIHVFSDRVEVRNPGSLPPGFTIDHLKRSHTSIPRYPLMADPLYLAHYIEQAGTGTLDMISLCREAGIPEPDFEQDGDEFVVVLWRDWLSDSYIVSMKLNQRQAKIISHLKMIHEITNAQYREITGATPKTASRDLEELVEKGVLVARGTGRGAHYVLEKNSQNLKPTDDRSTGR